MTFTCLTLHKLFYNMPLYAPFSPGYLCLPEGSHPQYDVRGGGEEDGGGHHGALQVSLPPR